MANRLVVKAPGKLLLAGEYAVLFGSPALVLATAPWATLTVESANHTYQPLFPSAKRNLSYTSNWLSTQAFFREDEKLGFGSSAAAAVLLALRQLQAGQISTSIDRQTLWQVAQKCHQEMLGSRGSGADIAAIIEGQCGLFLPAQQGYHWQVVTFPNQVSMVVVFAEKSANTRQWTQWFRDKFDHDINVRNWCKRCHTLLADFGDGEQTTLSWETFFFAAASLYRELKNLISPDIYTEKLSYFDTVANGLNIPFKPSGAGGGDLGFFFCKNQTVQNELRQYLNERSIAHQVVWPTTMGAHWQKISLCKKTQNHLECD